MLLGRGVKRQHRSRPTSNLRIQGLDKTRITLDQGTRKRPAQSRDFLPIRGLNYRIRGVDLTCSDSSRQRARTPCISKHFIGNLSPPSCPPAAGFGFSKPGGRELPCQLPPLPLLLFYAKGPPAFLTVSIACADRFLPPSRRWPSSVAHNKR